jgi:hypothetical protein
MQDGQSRLPNGGHIGNSLSGKRSGKPNRQDFTSRESPPLGINDANQPRGPMAKQFMQHPHLGRKSPIRALAATRVWAGAEQVERKTRDLDGYFIRLPSREGHIEMRPVSSDTPDSTHAFEHSAELIRFG